MLLPGVGSPVQLSDQLELHGSREIRLLLASGESGLLMAPDELLMRDPSGHGVKSEAPF